MGFYGKIYEQMGDVFNRAKFINVSPNTKQFNNDPLQDIVIDAESHGDRLPIMAGNSWIQFVAGRDEKNSPACIIYHSAPLSRASNSPNSIIGDVIRTSGNSDFLTLTDADSTLLTPEEKQELLDKADKLLYFGDKIILYTPIKDDAGHIITFEEKEWELGSIPRLTDILTAEERIAFLETVVGVEEYPNEKGTISYRVLTLEEDFENVRKIADDAAILATEADASAKAAQEAADNAALSSEQSAASAERIGRQVDNFIEQTSDTLARYDGRIRGNSNAIGAGDSDTIKNELDTNSLVDWAQVIIGIIGDDYNDIRDDVADTITDQIHSNDADIAQLRTDLTKEISDRAADVDAEETARKAEIVRLEGIISDNKEACNTALGEEAAARAAADDALQTSINNEVNRAALAENTLTSNLNGEVARATQAENTLTINLGNEVTRATLVEQGLDTRLTAVEAKAATNSEKLVGDETVAGSVASKIKTAIDAEANLRVAKDNALADEIGRLADLISNLSGLVEAQQTTISELQERIVVLESYHNTTEDPTPGEEENPTE